MSTTIWIVIGLVFVVVWSWIGWEVYNAPLMPDDYGTERTDIDDKYDGWHPDQDIK